MSSKVQPVPKLDLTLINGVWDFAAKEQKTIKAHWAKQTKDNDYLFDGKVLIAPEFGFAEDGSFYARHLAVDFSAFLTWRDLFLPHQEWDNPHVLNIFGSAVVVSQEGYLLMGIMGAQTSNAGLIYPASGMPDLDDVDAAGRLNVFASLKRELKEEMGLDANDACIGQAYIIEDGWRRSVAQLLHFDKPAEALVADIHAYHKTAADDELEGVAVIKSVNDIVEDRMPSYVPELIRYYFSQ